MEKSIVNFLLGESDYDGFWFHEKPLDKRGQFWWRRNLRQEIKTLSGKKIECWIKTGHGQGKEFMFDLSAAPRVGEELMIPGVLIYKTVERIVHDIDNNRLIICTN